MNKSTCCITLGMVLAMVAISFLVINPFVWNYEKLLVWSFALVLFIFSICLILVGTQIETV